MLWWNWTTPDDFTREIAAKAFTNGALEFHEETKQKLLIDLRKKHIHTGLYGISSINANLLKKML